MVFVRFPLELWQFPLVSFGVFLETSGDAELGGVVRIALEASFFVYAVQAVDDLLDVVVGVAWHVEFLRDGCNANLGRFPQQPRALAQVSFVECVVGGVEQGLRFLCVVLG